MTDIAILVQNRGGISHEFYEFHEKPEDHSRNSCQFVAKNMSDIAIRVENLSKRYPSTGPWSSSRVAEVRETIVAT